MRETHHSRNFAGALAIAMVAPVAPHSTSLAHAAVDRAGTVELTPIGRLETGLFDMGASEIAAYHPATKRLFVVNGAEGLDILDASDPSTLHRVAVRRMQNPTSVAVHGDVVAVATMGRGDGVRGTVRFFDPQGTELGRVQVGFGPDMIAFAPDGRTLLVACEGEPSAIEPTMDPPGTISIIDLSRGVSSASVVDAGFERFESQRAALIDRGLRVVVPGKSLVDDLEPEYIAFAPDGRFAFVTLQENNAIAIVDVAARRVQSIEPLGFRDCARPGMGLDGIADGRAAPRPVPVMAMYQPDGIVAFEVDGALWLATANEGESRESSFNEVITLQQGRMALGPDEEAMPAEGALQVSCVRAPESFGGGFCAFGTRSVSLWRVMPEALRTSANEDASDASVVVSGAEIGSAAITPAWDSGDAIERIVAERTPALFNVDHRKTPRVDARSLNKGPEPEGIATGFVHGRRMLFVTLERSGGVVVIDASDPLAPSLVGYANPRRADVDLSIDVDRNAVPDALASAGDLGPEGVLFIPRSLSPTGEDMVVVCNEVSGATTLWHIDMK